MTVPKPLRFFVGMIVASIFSLAYIIAPLYMISSLILLVMYPGVYSVVYIIPLLFSAIIPVIQMPWLVKSDIVGCMRDYFNYEEILETSDDELLNEHNKLNRSVILTGLPHGVLSFGGLCAGSNADMRWGALSTAAAGAVLATPIIKHIIGIFGLIDASAASLKRHLKKGGIAGSFVLYPGGIAELFKCSEDKEILFLKERKGFIKLALRENADVIPMYFFGNTSVLTIPKSSILETLSRKYQVSLTIFWGFAGLPIPRPNKILYVRGKCLNLPHIEDPTEADVNKWHEVYVKEVQRIFETYKSKVPEYANKSLLIE